MSIPWRTRPETRAGEKPQSATEAMEPEKAAKTEVELQESIVIAEKKIAEWVAQCPIKNSGITRGTTFTFLGIDFLVTSATCRSGYPNLWPFVAIYRPRMFNASLTCIYCAGSSIETRGFSVDEVALVVATCTLTNPEEKL